jgi:hypothetical protein
VNAPVFKFRALALVSPYRSIDAKDS